MPNRLSLLIIYNFQDQANNLQLILNAIVTLDTELQQGTELISPLMPATIIGKESRLTPLEERLLVIVRAGHLHQISRHPRLDLHYEDEVTDVARARRLAKGALVHLASHSEHWQRQTLSGVIPKKILAKHSQDDYGIYENRVYVHLIDQIESHLRARIETLNGLQCTLNEALNIYQTTDIHYQLREAVCRLWGMALDQSNTSKASDLLHKTLETLHYLHQAISGLQQSGLYLLVNRNAQVGALHMTNILSHDEHYRYLGILWESFRTQQGKKKPSPVERFKYNQYLVQAYSNYAGLVLRHALFPYLNGQFEGAWAGRILKLRKIGLEWELVSTSIKGETTEEILLTVVPWLNNLISTDYLKKLPANRVIAWPGISQIVDQDTFQDQLIVLSPSDMYCVERFGQLIDRALNLKLLKTYGQPLTKIPKEVLGMSQLSSALYLDQNNYQLIVREVLPESVLQELKKVLLSNNAMQQVEELELRNMEILVLQKCPVCKTSNRLISHQSLIGFKMTCETCKVERYLQHQKDGLEFDQKIAGKAGFQKFGRRTMSLHF